MWVSSTKLNRFINFVVYSSPTYTTVQPTPSPPAYMHNYVRSVHRTFMQIITFISTLGCHTVTIILNALTRAGFVYHSREPSEPPFAERATAPTSEPPPRHVREGPDRIPGATFAGQGDEDGEVLAHLSSRASTGSVNYQHNAKEWCHRS